MNLHSSPLYIHLSYICQYIAIYSTHERYKNDDKQPTVSKDKSKDFTYKEALGDDDDFGRKYPAVL